MSRPEYSDRHVIVTIAAEVSDMDVKETIHIFNSLMEMAGITVNGNQPYDIRIHNENIYSRVLDSGPLGLGESYMDCWWECESLDQFTEKLLRANLKYEIKRNLQLAWHILKSRLINLQSVTRAFQVGETHYDIGNDLYEKMLDKRMMYTCA